jgi:hypothetical protein
MSDSGVESEVNAKHDSPHEKLRKHHRWGFTALISFHWAWIDLGLRRILIYGSYNDKQMI